MIDIQALKKAAEAAKPCGNSWYDAEWMVRQGIKEQDAEMLLHLDPATVLELCRLAEIGHCFAHDDPGEAKRAKMLRLTDEYAIAHGGPATLEELQK